jgi:hypothetical protein
MSVDHKNFYETIQEANMRLRRTIVLYGDDPYYVHAVTNHTKDGIFRVYISEITRVKKIGIPALAAYPQEHPALGVELDKYVKSKENKGLERKRINSPHFNRFRPFPLGMCNTGEAGAGRCFYIARCPQKRTEQGLTGAHVEETEVTLGDKSGRPDRHNVALYSDAFYATIKGIYPTPKEILAAFGDPDIDNEAVGFHRDFALVRGPIDSLYLGYKDRIIGVMPKGDLSEVRLSKRNLQTREIVEALDVFGTVGEAR